MTGLLTPSVASRSSRGPAIEAGVTSRSCCGRSRSGSGSVSSSQEGEAAGAVDAKGHALGFLSAAAAGLAWVLLQLVFGLIAPPDPLTGQVAPLSHVYAALLIFSASVAATAILGRRLAIALGEAAQSTRLRPQGPAFAVGSVAFAGLAVGFALAFSLGLSGYDQLTFLACIGLLAGAKLKAKERGTLLAFVPFAVAMGVLISGTGGQRGRRRLERVWLFAQRLHRLPWDQPGLEGRRSCGAQRVHRRRARRFPGDCGPHPPTARASRARTSRAVAICPSGSTCRSTCRASCPRHRGSPHPDGAASLTMTRVCRAFRRFGDEYRRSPQPTYNPLGAVRGRCRPYGIPQFAARPAQWPVVSRARGRGP